MSKRKNFFSNLVFALLKDIINFKHISKNDDPHSWWISEIKGSEKGRWINV